MNTLDETAVRRAYREVLAPAFGPDELPDEDDFVIDWMDGDLEVVVTCDAEDAPLAVAVAEHDIVGGWLLLSWLAVRPELRGSGLGSDLLSRVLAEWQSAWHPRLVLAEVEPDPARERFYARLGARALRLRYVQPPVALGRNPVPMLLVVLREHARPPGEFVDAGAVRSFLASQDQRCAEQEWLATDPLD